VQELQEQELQSPEQQLQLQGDILKMGWWTGWIGLAWL
jgi:hypothetical protein